MIHSHGVAGGGRRVRANALWLSDRRGERWQMQREGSAGPLSPTSGQEKPLEPG